MPASSSINGLIRTKGTVCATGRLFPQFKLSRRSSCRIRQKVLDEPDKCPGETGPAMGRRIGRGRTFGRDPVAAAALAGHDSKGIPKVGFGLGRGWRIMRAANVGRGMSLAETAPTAPTSLASATGRALPRRFLALVVDTVVISLIDAIVNGTFGVTRVTSGVATYMSSGSITSFTTQTMVDWPWLALLWVTYYAVLEGLFGATLGKRAVRLRVTDVNGHRIGWQAAIVRNLARLLDVLPFGYLLGGILTVVTRQHQRLGDRLAGTLVVPAEAAVGPPLPSDIRRRRAIGVVTTAALLLAFCAGFAYFGRPPLVIEGARNTSSGIFSDGVGSYKLGSPHWGTGTVMYPISYEIARTSQTCQGMITLDWTWYFPGWDFSSGETQCSPRIYP